MDGKLLTLCNVLSEANLCFGIDNYVSAFRLQKKTIEMMLKHRSMESMHP